MPVPTAPYNISQPNPAGGGYTMPQTTFPSTIMYTVQGPQRPLSAPGMSQPQQITQKREKKVLQIVDPSTGKDILSDYNTQRSTPPGSSGSGSRGQTPNETMEVSKMFKIKPGLSLFFKSTSTSLFTGTRAVLF